MAATDMFLRSGPTASIAVRAGRARTRTFQSYTSVCRFPSHHIPICKTRHWTGHGSGIRLHASTAPAPAGDDTPAAGDVPAPAPATAAPPASVDDAQSGVLSVFRVFSDKACNQKFLALTIGQTLSSVATLIHDSYLPVYVQDVLGLSNTKVWQSCVMEEPQ